ncbi:hypothetical protein B4098_3419 [Heyndrickxia coagulans]|uniref:Uncharacterized protein n=1 Tax=Heyndrickxia coagulans TaxID=1398 RepID=A0A150K474_HEYCO|nr:hypothetical protein B4099_3815 [Heyndrickxia coagulans]KYC64246.1 hypothetical protein B4098_3419 [Heyndrickxia coagulans]
MISSVSLKEDFIRHVTFCFKNNTFKTKTLISSTISSTNIFVMSPKFATNVNLKQIRTKATHAIEQIITQ